MNIGIFTDTYFPQVSGVATSIKTLKDQLEKDGHQVYIFTTTDPHVDKSACEKNIFRFSSIPFISFTDRRIAVRGMIQAYQIAKKLNLDIIHTQTEFSMGIIGKVVAKFLRIPCVHTYHTMYEDYLHYVAKGKILRPIHVKDATLAFCHNMSGVVAPSTKVLDTLVRYGVKSPIRIIPTGINIGKFNTDSDFDLRTDLGVSSDAKILLSVSRLAYEKNIKELINSMPDILKDQPNTHLVIVGDGPAKDDLKQQTNDMNLNDNVHFVGEINNDEVYKYYHSADIFVSTSNSESQGLTYIEAMAAGVKVVVSSSPYTEELLDNKSLGMTFSTPEGYIEKVLEYLNATQQNDTQEDMELRSNKLHEISSENFANRIVDFYRCAQLDYNKEIRDDDEVSE
ncbi:glycosyltransferase family 4 protein [Apilactobacillus apinorum]|uniref:Glycosyltransferase family 4 protein n=1 Tax=Apilactobacillus apinorum TaxID=1218495 RepID=A0ABP9ZGB3_9LACO|nr:glycosyltransferase family 4 protein [Apilactobacillus apinorum]KOY68554.1 1,2-diacylglycerol 3-glucosyltransferase [Apilactobacillus apinorum]CAI2682570.1 1,2-diacylglycerol 3-glucosyltransferase [Apilactobacillus apinorum]